MALQYATPPSLGTIATSVITLVTFDIVGSRIFFGVTHYDAAGNQIGQETLENDAPNPTVIANVKTAAYNYLQSKRGAGTVT